jgi:hypothetical protein
MKRTCDCTTATFAPLTCYQKGTQLVDPDSRWFRVELDLRHTWPSCVTQQGKPLSVFQEMGMWESSGMVKRCACLAPEQLAKHAHVADDKLNGTHLTQ